MEPPSISRSPTLKAHPTGVLPVRVRMHIYTNACIPRGCAFSRHREKEDVDMRVRARVDISVYILLCTYCEPFSAKPHGTHERVSNSHQRNVYTPLAGGPRGKLVARSEGIATRGWARSRERKSEEHSVWRGWRRWRGELDFSDSKFCSSLFPAPRTNTEPPPTRPHRQPPRHPTPPPIHPPERRR